MSLADEPHVRASAVEKSTVNFFVKRSRTVDESCMVTAVTTETSTALSSLLHLV
jgi:hypothetical protein